MIIVPKELTRETFAAFGDVLECEGLEPALINHGLTRKYAPLSVLDIDPGGQVQLALYRSQAVELPFRLRELERHPLSSQAFVPLHDRPFPVVVARAGDAPAAADVCAFLTNGHQGVSLMPGVWHHHQLTLGVESDYLVAERGSGEGNLDLLPLDEELYLGAPG